MFAACPDAAVWPVHGQQRAMADLDQPAYCASQCPAGSIGAASSDEREVLVAVVAVQQDRPAGGGNSAGCYGGRRDLRERPITPAANRPYGSIPFF